MAKEISDFMDITPDKQRMDSLMVAANIRNLSLLELLSLIHIFKAENREYGGCRFVVELPIQKDEAI